MTKPGRLARFDYETRVRAVRLVTAEGWSTTEACRAVGCSRRTIQDWIKKSAAGTSLGHLKTPPPPGAPSKLTTAEKSRLVKLLTAGPEAAGFTSQLWTSRLVEQLIRRTFGVAYHVEYIPRLLRQLGFSPQRPRRRAGERDEAVVATWKARAWPRIKKKPGRSMPS